MEKLNFFVYNPFTSIVTKLIRPIPYFRFLFVTQHYLNYASLNFWFKQKVLNIGGNRNAYWPVHWTSKVHDVENIIVGVDSAPGINGGAYITARGGLEIGDYCMFAKNIVIVTSNHNTYDYRINDIAPVKIGNYCWLGAGAKILPGVVLGPHTIVGAGAVVTKSFPEGYCIIGGVPAKEIKKIDPKKCNDYQHEIKYCGYIKIEQREQYLHGLKKN